MAETKRTEGLFLWFFLFFDLDYYSTEGCGMNKLRLRVRGLSIKEDTFSHRVQQSFGFLFNG